MERDRPARAVVAAVASDGDVPHGPTRIPGTNVATITGYACACPTPDAPTRPAVVVDPFLGTGTSLLVARALGRHGHGVDLSNDYLRLAQWRIWEDHNAFRKASERSGIPVPQPPTIDGQMSLMDAPDPAPACVVPHTSSPDDLTRTTP